MSFCGALRVAYFWLVGSVVFSLSRSAFAQPDRPVWRWGADAEGGAPYVFKDPSNPAKTIGFEVDLAQALSEQMGQPIERVQYDYGSLIVGLERGDIDLAMNGIEITPDRSARILFSDPYYVYRLQLVVRNNEHLCDSLDLCIKNNGTVGTLGDTAAERLLDSRRIKKRIYEGQVEPYSDLELGRTNAVLLDLPIALYYAKNKSTLRFASVEGESGFYAIALRKSDLDRKQKIDAALAALGNDGRLAKIYEKWSLWNNDQDALRAKNRPQVAPSGSAPLASNSPAQTGNKPPPATQANSDSVGPQSGPALLTTTWTLKDYLPLLLAGLANTVIISVCSMALAVLWGLGLAMARLWGNHLLKALALAYIEFFRGVPVLLVLFLLYYGLPNIGVEMGPYQAAILGFGLNYAAYEAEIYRASIDSVPSGQWEAATVLGMGRWLTLRRIIFPQAIRVALPVMTTDFVALFKDTSLVSVLAVVELTKQYQILAKSSMKYLEIGAVTAILYLLVSLPLGVLARWLEKRWSVGHRGVI